MNTLQPCSVVHTRPFISVFIMYSLQHHLMMFLVIYSIQKNHALGHLADNFCGMAKDTNTYIYELNIHKLDYQ